MNTKKNPIDRHLDNILKASGTALANFETSAGALKGMRAALLAAVAELAPASAASANHFPDAAKMVVELSDEQIEEILLAHGYTIRPGFNGLKRYVIDGARALLVADRAAARQHLPAHAPTFSAVAAGKLAELQAKGFTVTGVSIEKTEATGQVTRGFVTHGGLVGWWVMIPKGDDLVMISRDLVGAACSAIDKKRDAPQTLELLRKVAMSDAIKQADKVLLTDEQIDQLAGENIEIDRLDYEVFELNKASAREFARAIEAAHGIKAAGQEGGTS